jgi:hypothetical protein
MITKSKICAALLSVGAVVAVGPAAGLEVRTAGDISYVSGGVGASEQEELAQVKSDYNLRLLFAVTGSGAFLAKVPVTIADQAGQVVLEAVSDGPYFYANLPAGTYRVSAENAGNAQTRSVTVPASGGVSESFYWSPEQ